MKHTKWHCAQHTNPRMNWYVADDSQCNIAEKLAEVDARQIVADHNANPEAVKELIRLIPTAIQSLRDEHAESEIATQLQSALQSLEEK